METILLQIRNKRDRRLLEAWLENKYRILPREVAEPLELPFDLAIIDGPHLKRLRRKVRARRQAEEPVLLPFLLVAARRRGAKPVRYLGGLVDDVIVRPLDQDEFVGRVRNLIRLRCLSLDLKKEHDLVTRLSVTDDVSGFYNTRYLHRKLDRLLSRTSSQDLFSLVFFDLDNFKHVVDTYGHPLGAKALREVAQAVARTLDEDDRLVRYGGDEFVVILPRQSKDEALAKIERMSHALDGTAFLQKEHRNVHLTASFGLATYPEDAHNKKELLAAADKCLFRSKTEGKARISYAEAHKSQPAAA